MRNQAGKFFVTLLTVCALVALCAVTGAAQRRGRERRQYEKAEVDAVIHRVEDRTDIFMRLFDSSLDRSRLDGTRREDRLNERAKELRDAVSDLRRAFDRTNSYYDTRPQVNRCLNLAGGIDKVVRRRRLGGDTERTWGDVRAELNALADVYGLSRMR